MPISGSLSMKAFTQPLTDEIVQLVIKRAKLDYFKSMVTNLELQPDEVNRADTLTSKAVDFVVDLATNHDFSPDHLTATLASLPYTQDESLEKFPLPIQTFLKSELGKLLDIIRQSLVSRSVEMQNIKSRLILAAWNISSLTAKNQHIFGPEKESDETVYCRAILSGEKEWSIEDPDAGINVLRGCQCLIHALTSIKCESFGVPEELMEFHAGVLARAARTMSRIEEE